MPAAVPLIVGAAASYGTTALIAGTILEGTFAATLIAGSAGLIASGLVSNAMAPSPSNPDVSAFLNNPGGARTQQFRQPTAPHEVVFGRIKKSGPIMFIHSAPDDDGRADGYFYIQHALASHHVKAIGDVYLGDTLSTDATFSGLLQIGKNLGTTTQTEDANFLSDLPTEFANHRLRGRANIATRLKVTVAAFPSGIPNIVAILDGCDEIYDPRTAATGFTNNAALCIAKWLTAPWGMNRAWAQLDEDSVIAAANICDERVLVLTGTTTFTADVTSNALTLAAGARVLDWGDGVRVSTSSALPGGLAAATTYYVIPFDDGMIKLAASQAGAFAGTAIDITSAGTGTQTLTYYDEARYKCNGSFALDAAKRDVLENLLSAMAGVVVRLGGKWYVHAGAAALPTVTLNADDLRGAMTTTPKRSMRDRFNGVRAVFVNPDQAWQPADAPPLAPTAALLVEDGGEELYTDIRLPFTTSARCAQRLMKIHRERNRRQRTVEFPAKLTGMRLAPWDGVYLTIDRGDGSLYFDAAQHRVSGWSLAVDGGIDLVLSEDDSEVYAWEATEELGITAGQAVTLPDASAIAAPASVTVTTPTTPAYTTLTATWAEVLSIWADGYDVEYRSDGVTDWTGYGRVGSTAARSVTVDRATPQDFQVRAVTKNGSVSAFTQNLAPAVPTSPNATGGSGQIDLTWVTGSGAVDVQIFRHSADTFASATLLVTTPSDGAYSDTGLGSTETWYYWLRSVNADGNISTQTASVNATTS